MIYPENFERKIGFDRLREQVSALCSTSASRRMVAEAAFMTDSGEIMRRQSLAEQMRLILQMEHDAPSHEFPDAETVTAKLRVEGMFLDAAALRLLRQALCSAGEWVAFLQSRGEERYPDLVALSRSVETLPEVIGGIDAIIDERGEVRDTASEELALLRRRLRQCEGQAAKRLQAVLQRAKEAGVVEADAALSIRDGRAVIPVAASNKRKLPGFIHDESASGRTFYIEPVEVVELNNELREIEYAERREVVRILTEFTESIRPKGEAIEAAGAFLAELDFTVAKARWAVSNGAVCPLLATEGDMVLRKARHPLLQQTLQAQGREIVPLDMTLDASRRILVISGPNAGGKSVCLKTAGMTQYMFQCGFPVTASENTELPVFESIYIDIGDEQSMDDDLSTYSSHLRNMRHVLAAASPRTMVLIDEFGSGTEPTIGGAIAEAILERLVERGCYGVITTHYANLKYYASAHEGVQNGAMMFDVQNIRPLFRLDTGRPGSSFAIEIARKTGLPEDIISAAADKAGSDHINIEKQLRDIARDRRYWEQKRDRIRIADRRVEELERDYAERLERIRQERNEIIRTARDEAKQIVAEANRIVENTIRSIRESQAEKETTRLVRREMDTFRDKVENDLDKAFDDKRIAREMERLAARTARRAERRRERSEKQTEPAAAEPRRAKVEAGSKVRLEGQSAAGVVESINGKRARVIFGQITTSVEVERLSVISEGEYRESTRPAAPRTVISTDISQRRLAFRDSIDVRGMRVTEALDAVRDLVDDAIMVGVSSVTILHGKGTGALKEEIRRYLRTVRGIASVEDEHADRGGAGITIVKFEE